MVHIMTRAERMIHSYNQDTDTCGKSLMQHGVHIVVMLRSRSTEKGKYFASSINFISILV